MLQISYTKGMRKIWWVGCLTYLLAWGILPVQAQPGRHVLRTSRALRQAQLGRVECRKISPSGHLNTPCLNKPLLQTKLAQATNATSALIHFEQFAKRDQALLPRLPAGQANPLLVHTFQARALGQEKTNFFSGTLVEVMYKGRKEVYGVVSAHALSRSAADYSLQRHLMVDVAIGGKFISVPVEIVQVGTPSLIDLALVKFPAEVEAQLRPLKISNRLPQYNENLISQGFASQQVHYVPERIFLKANPFSLQTTIPLARDVRVGFCGSPLVNQQGDLVGVHVGSTYGRYDELGDKGFAVPAQWINRLVEAYHEGPYHRIPIEVNGHTVAVLGINDYITEVALFNHAGKQVFTHSFKHKFSYSKLQELIEIFSPAALELKVQHGYWDREHLEFWVERSGYTGPDQAAVYRYDFNSRRCTQIPVKRNSL